MMRGKTSTQMGFNEQQEKGKVNTQKYFEISKTLTFLKKIVYLHLWLYVELLKSMLSSPDTKGSLVENVLQKKIVMC